MPSKTGSFGAGQADIEARIRQERAAKLMDQEAARQKEAAEKAEAPAAASPAVAEEPWEAVPKRIGSGVYGFMPFEAFKRRYASVWEQVASKDHLMTGRFSYETTLLGRPLKLRSMTRREEKALSCWLPSPLASGATAAEIEEAQTEYVTLRLVLQVERIGDVRGPAVRLTPETRDAWRKDPVVTQMLDYIYDLDTAVSAQLVALLNDFDVARQYALLENLRNP